MNEEQRVAYQNSMVACAMIEAMGMQAENMQREVSGDSPAFGYEQFRSLIDEYGLHHNAAVEQLFGR